MAFRIVPIRFVNILRDSWVNRLVQSSHQSSIFTPLYWLISLWVLLIRIIYLFYVPSILNNEINRLAQAFTGTQFSRIIEICIPRCSLWGLQSSSWFGCTILFWIALADSLLLWHLNRLLSLWPGSQNTFQVLIRSVDGSGVSAFSIWPHIRVSRNLHSPAVDLCGGSQIGTRWRFTYCNWWPYEMIRYLVLVSSLLSGPHATLLSTIEQHCSLLRGILGGRRHPATHVAAIGIRFR